MPPLLKSFEAMAVHQHRMWTFGWGQKQIDGHLAVDSFDLKIFIVFHNLVPRTGVEPVRG
jgi:hypothetical protein